MTSGIINDFYYSDSPLTTLQDRHRHNVYQMLYIVEGCLSCEIAGNSIKCVSPALVFIGNCEPHVITSTSEKYVRYVLSLDPYQTNSLIRPKLLQSVFSFHPAGFSHALDITPISSEIDILMRELFSEWTLPKNKKLPEGEALLLSALLYKIRQFAPELFTEKNYGSAEMLVASVRMDLECNFASPLDLDELAEKYHVSRYYLSHVFKQASGYSLKEYLMLCRISYACQILGEESSSIKEIAEKSGFRDLSNFSRYFKKITGMSPSDYKSKTK
ncbi:MAG: helix-turn-helix domain-containing protein [Ruminococcaceae bacterium]|nr:helix-turn-helix domain-containing protein [Oscillospiraceae bacterium]